MKPSNIDDALAELERQVSVLVSEVNDARNDIFLWESELEDLDIQIEKLKALDKAEAEKDHG